jgi:hypothetical protein
MDYNSKKSPVIYEDTSSYATAICKGTTPEEQTYMESTLDKLFYLYREINGKEYRLGKVVDKFEVPEVPKTGSGDCITRSGIKGRLEDLMDLMEELNIKLELKISRLEGLI